jgi:hypothetical protein
MVKYEATKSKGTNILGTVGVDEKRSACTCGWLFYDVRMLHRRTDRPRFFVASCSGGRPLEQHAAVDRSMMHASVCGQLRFRVANATF